MRKVAPIASLVFLIAAACGGPSAAEKQVHESAPVQVQTTPAQAGTIPDNYRWYGSIIANRSARIAADTNGTIEAVYMERGTSVRAGQVLAKVDTQIGAFSEAASKAQAEAAHIQLAAAEMDCQRVDALFAGQAVSQAQYDRQKAGCEAQAAQARAASASASIASTNLAKNTIRAPFDGVIGERMVQVGEFVGSASPVATIVALDPVRVQFAVPEAEISAAQLGATVQVSVTSWPGEIFQGVVAYASPDLRANSRDRVIEATIDNPDHRLLPGMFATVTVSKRDVDVVLVPESSVIGTDAVRRIFVVADGTAQERIVRTGEPIQSAEGIAQIPVFNELTAGEQVVISPPSELRDGAKVM